jgi:hypothetical protein
MIRKPLFALAIGMLQVGCASDYIRVTEYDASSPPIPGVTATAGGCMVSQEGNAPAGVLTYNGKRCTYTTAE